VIGRQPTPHIVPAKSPTPEMRPELRGEFPIAASTRVMLRCDHQLGPERYTDPSNSCYAYQVILDA